MKTDPISMEILRNLVVSITEEMGSVLKRAAWSPNIKERMDASCALFDAQARLIAQADHIPVHLGSMPDALAAIQSRIGLNNLHPGDQVILNDPFEGGTHLPDITLVKPVFVEFGLVGFAVNKAHHSDVGGITPGSMPAFSKNIQDEGLLIPPVHLLKKGTIQPEIMSMILESTRTPDDRNGDLQAQIAANNRGATRLEQLVERSSLPVFSQFVDDMIDYSQNRVMRALNTFSCGTYSACDWLESPDQSGEDIKLVCSVTVSNSSVSFDFTGSANQVDCNLNAPVAVTRSAVFYVFRCLTDPEIPANHGSYKAIKITIPPGTILNPDRGRAVVAGNVETSQRVVDLLFAAFEQARPEVVPAQSQGTMNNLTFGGTNRDESPFTYYETIGGGEGALPWRNGQDGIHVHMTNTANTPAEIIEEKYPLRVRQYSLRQGSGGPGKFSGGRGITRSFEILIDDVSMQVISERRRLSPTGLHGGLPGKTGQNEVQADRGTLRLKAKDTANLKRGDRITIHTPGGGGYGSPDLTRDNHQTTEENHD